MKVLLTGGCGFIGSHAAVELLRNDFDVVIVDNLSNSSVSVIDSIHKITNRTVKFYNCDILNKSCLDDIFNSEKPDTVIHFAGLKAVGESVSLPLDYYDNNLVGTINLLKVMKKHNVKKIVFSSSATVYGAPKTVPITEDFPLSVTNPYGRTKLIIEEILKDLYNSDKSWDIVVLRYFNPVGADKSGLLGENPCGIPNNLMPYVMKVANGELDCVKVFGDDYDTHDGTGVRDYIHVTDLAQAHLAAINKIIKDEQGFFTYNIGSGKGASVMEVIHAVEKAVGNKISYKIEPRRQGDIAACYANCDKAKLELEWESKLGLEEMCRDAWNFQKNNTKK